MQTNERRAKARCANGHDRILGFYDLTESGKYVRHVAYVRAALGEVFGGNMDIWRDDGTLPKCPCGADFTRPATFI